MKPERPVDLIIIGAQKAGTTPGSKAQGGLSSQLKRKAGDVFSGTSKLTKQTAPESLH